MSKDDNFKYQIIQGFINAAKEDHVIMRLPVEYYKKEIESLIKNSIKKGDEAGLDNSFGVTIKTIAIMDSDWDNGKNKLETAKAFMGPAIFDDFKKNYPEKYNKLIQDNKGQ